MKKKIVLGVVALSVVGASLAYGGIVGSRHDMSQLTDVTASDKGVCAYCHTPHHALSAADATAAGVTYNPLWSHDLTEATSSEYTSVTLDGDNSDPLAGNSRLCMSCHDGVVAVDQHYGSLTTETTAASEDADGDLLTGDGWGEIAVGLGGDLTNDHPVGFSYVAAAAADDEINPTSTALPMGGTIVDVLEGGVTMTCGSCHDVHGTDSVAGRYFLIGLQAGSEICLICHAK